jgi:hypothetical protein
MLDLRSTDIDQTQLHAALSALSDADLAALEDDLNFCSFTGVPTRRVLEVLNELIELDPDWARLLAKRRRLNVPAAY